MASSDITPPAPIADLAATPQSDTVVRLAWTAPGDDGNTGTATVYSVRRSASRILTDADFDAATVVAGMTAPKAAGGAETFDVTGLIANTAYYFAVKTKDEASSTANWSGLSNWTSATTGTGGGAPAVNHLVLSQFSIAGTGNDTIEIYNPTSSGISLANYSLQNLSTSGNNGFQVVLNGAKTVAAHSWYLVAGTSYAGSPSADETWNNDSSHNFSNTAGHIVLVSQTASIGTGACDHAAIVDKVGYAATATCPEGGSGKNTGVPTTSQSVIRKPGGTSGNGQDTNVNSDDFSAPGTPAYHNALSAPATPPSGLGNVGPTLYLSGSGTTGLAWAKAVAATSYRVYRGTAADFMAGAPAPWQTVVANSVTDPSSPSPIYVYVVHAWDGTNESAD
jgi:hypothetical protein